MARRLEELEVTKDTQSGSHFRHTSAKLSRVQFFNLLSTWWRSVLRCQLAPQYMQLGQAPLQAPSLEQAIVNLSKNPKGIHEMEAQEGESFQMREVKVVITLRSGKEVDLPTPKPEHEPETEVEKRRGRKQRKEEREQYKERGP
ncbi:hypothetical protein CK203_112436 [Vitis vinifera]|uniref:Uncharacterized protein n=1 Tax=Vitis vinifera TaxID=29760 RepID=A0A438FD93_VITVI|nr:hypothetical protein CK203_112436 [Vitis vinifera]